MDKIGTETNKFKCYIFVVVFLLFFFQYIYIYIFCQTVTEFKDRLIAVELILTGINKLHGVISQLVSLCVDYFVFTVIRKT